MATGWLRLAGETARLWECPSEGNLESVGDDGSDEPGNRLATQLLGGALADGRLLHGDLVRFYCDSRRSGLCVVDATREDPVLRQLFCNEAGGTSCFTGCREHQDEVPAAVTRWIEDPVGFYAPCFAGSAAELQRFYATGVRADKADRADPETDPDGHHGGDAPDLLQPGRPMDRADDGLGAICLHPVAHLGLLQEAVGGRPVSEYVAGHTAWIPEAGALGLLLPDGLADWEPAALAAVPPEVRAAVGPGSRLWTTWGDQMLRLDQGTQQAALAFDFGLAC
jgi:hypothetical protein